MGDPQVEEQGRGGKLWSIYEELHILLSWHIDFMGEIRTMI